MNTPTPAKVAAVNALGVRFNALLPILLAAAGEIIAKGTQVAKADGGLTVAAKKILPPLPPCCWYSTDYGLKAHLTADVFVDGRSERAQSIIYLMGGTGPGETPYLMQGHVPLRTDWSLADVQFSLSEIRHFEAKANAHRNALHLFA